MQSRRFWYEQNTVPENSLRLPVLSSRVRLARNIAGIPFPNRMSMSQYRSLKTSTTLLLSGHAFDECKSGVNALVTPTDFLFSFGANSQASVAIGNTETGQMIVLGDEDHFRICTVAPESRIDDVLAATVRLEQFLANNFEFAFDRNRFGFLTASMANAGLAMRVSVWMHLPGLLLTDRWADLLPLLVSMDISVRGIMGENSDVEAGMVQLSNRTSYGRTAHEITTMIKRVVELLDEAERDAMSTLLKEHHTSTFSYMRCMNVLEQPYVATDQFVHAVSAALLAAKLGYNVRFDVPLALRILIAGFKSVRHDGLVQMQVVRSYLHDTMVIS